MLILSDFKDSPNTARSLISRGETLVIESVRAGVEVESEDNVKTMSRQGHVFSVSRDRVLGSYTIHWRDQ